jgi:Holliday junction resolvase RusA-like endonuclease
MKAILKKHPDLDFFYAFVGGEQIPTKQDKFKPIKDKEIYIKADDEYKKLEDEDLYLKKDSENSLKVFETKLEEEIFEIVLEDDNFPIKKPQKVEVILHITMDEKRLKSVDIDNLTKSVLDIMNGLVYEDDSQILNILASKDIHPLFPLNSLMIGVRKIKNDNSDSWFNNTTLAYFDYEESESASKSNESNT